MQEGKSIVELRGDTEVVVTRSFDAPREMIWDAYTRPELVKRWLLGPDGWSMPVCEIDLRVGGAYRYRWRNDATGHEFGAEGEHLEVTPVSRLVINQRMEGMPGEMVCTLELSAAGGRTTLVTIMTFESRAARDGAAASGMTRGMEAGYARLEDILAGQAV